MIVVFGSINLDIFFRSARLPAAGETLLCPRAETGPGGKGANQALAARRAGAKVALFGKVGRDAFAQEALSLLARDGVDLGGIAVAEAATAIASITVAEDGENSIIVGSGANLEAKAAQVPDSALGPETLLVLQMELPPDETWALIARAKALGTRVMLNVAPAAPVPEEALAALDFLVVNEIEAAQVAEGLGLAASDSEVALRHLAERFGLTAVLTLGSKGSLCQAPEGRYLVPALPVTPLDTTGAGDCFVGVLAAGLEAGQALPEALRRAAVGSALCCTGLGAQTFLPDAADIEERLKDLPEISGL